jgi:hypothetical protein
MEISRSRSWRDGEGRRLHQRRINDRLKRWSAIIRGGVAGLNEFSRDVPALGNAISRNLPTLIRD